MDQSAIIKKRIRQIEYQIKKYQKFGVEIPESILQEQINLKQERIRILKYERYKREFKRKQKPETLTLRLSRLKYKVQCMKKEGLEIPEYMFESMKRVRRLIREEKMKPQNYLEMSRWKLSLLLSSYRKQGNDPPAEIKHAMTIVRAKERQSKIKQYRARERRNAKRRRERARNMVANSGSEATGRCA